MRDIAVRGIPSTKSSAHGNEDDILGKTEKPMTKVENIEKEVRALNDAELGAFRRWFMEFDAEVWDRQIERDCASRRLAELAKKSLKDHESGSSTEL